jgi:hypothetical protein
MGQRKKKNLEVAGLPAAAHENRRIDQRHDARSLGPVVARLIGGSEVRLMDFARRGVLLESDTRLLIGAKATIKITTTDTTISVRGQVVRSRVAGVKGGALMYHTALALEEDLGLMDAVAAPQVSEPVFDDHEDHEEPDELAETADLLIAGSERALAATAVTGPDAPSESVLELLANVPLDLAELRRRAAVNNW